MNHSDNHEFNRRQWLGASGAGLASLVLPLDAFAQQGGRRVLVIAATQDIPNFDPHIATGYSASFFLRNVYDALVRVEGSPPKPVPELAQSWTISGDGKTYTFKLSPAARFHNGKPLTRSFITSKESALEVLNKLDVTMDRVNATRATMGAVMNRLDHVINNLSNVSMNLSESRSHIEDADYAKASTELAKTQIMQQAATAVLAQANTSQQTVLKLLG